MVAGFQENQVYSVKLCMRGSSQGSMHVDVTAGPYKKADLAVFSTGWLPIGLADYTETYHCLAIQS